MNKATVALAAITLTAGAIAAAAPASADTECEPAAFFSLSNGSIDLKVWSGSGNCSDPSANVSEPFAVEDVSSDIAYTDAFNAFASGQSNNGDGTVDDYSIPTPTTPGTYGLAWTSSSIPFTLNPNNNGFAVSANGSLTIVQQGPALPQPPIALPPPPPPPAYSTTGNLTVTSHRGTDAELSGTLTTNDGLGGTVHPSGVRMDLERETSAGGWQMLIGGTTDSTGTVRFAGLNSYHSQIYKMVPQNWFANEGTYTAANVSVARSGATPLRLVVDGASRDGRKVTNYGLASFTSVWITKAPFAGIGFVDYPNSIHVYLQKYKGRGWHNVGRVLTASAAQTYANNDEWNLKYTGTFPSKTKFRWHYSGSSDYKAATSGSAIE